MGTAFVASESMLTFDQLIKKFNWSMLIRKRPFLS